MNGHQSSLLLVVSVILRLRLTGEIGIEILGVEPILMVLYI
jgi:hypothetical protein